MDYIAKLSIMLSVLILSGCGSCDYMSWDGVCHRYEGGYDSYRHLYETYQEKRMKKVVPGLGGALINPY